MTGRYWASAILVCLCLSASSAMARAESQSAGTQTATYSYDNAGSLSCMGDQTTDPYNCGGIGLVCSANHATPKCDAGQCVGACAPDYGDCNNDRQRDGCETSINSDVRNCGSCGLACSAENAFLPTCVAGVCGAHCEDGFADCNSQYGINDGCEANLQTSTTHCGGCWRSCSPVHNTPRCVYGDCRGICDPGYAHCDTGDGTDTLTTGCETNILNSVAHCGACGAVCSTNHIAAACTNGTCSGTCAAGWGDCNGNKQVDGCETALTSSTVNCGACGAVCSTNHIAAACTNSTCSGTCAAGWGDCNGNKQVDGCETALTSSTVNCGACGAVCSTNHIAAACTNGTCSGTCAAGWGDCNGNKQVDGCETSTTTISNCGACGRACQAGLLCRSGACVDPCSGVNCGTKHCDPDTGKCVSYIP